MSSSLATRTIEKAVDFIDGLLLCLYLCGFTGGRSYRDTQTLNEVTEFILYGIITRKKIALGVNIMSTKNEKKIVFSEEIDSKINGLTLGFAFIFVGLFLLFVPNYFGNELAGKIVQWVFIVVGALGLWVEFNKSKSMSTIKGFDDLWVGVLFLAVWAALFFILKNSLWNIIGFFCLIFGIYGASRGIFQIIYSIRLNQKDKVQAKKNIVSDVILFLTKLISLTLVVLQFIKAIQGSRTPL